MLVTSRHRFQNVILRFLRFSNFPGLRVHIFHSLYSTRRFRRFLSFYTQLAANSHNQSTRCYASKKVTIFTTAWDVKPKIVRGVFKCLFLSFRIQVDFRCEYGSCLKALTQPLSFAAVLSKTASRHAMTNNSASPFTRYLLFAHLLLGLLAAVQGFEAHLSYHLVEKLYCCSKFNQPI